MKWAAVFLSSLVVCLVSLATMQTSAVRLDLLSSELFRPVYATSPDDGTGRLFVVQLNGLVRTVVEGRVQEAPFLSLNGIVTALEGEQGFYSLAFHPAYQDNGRFFVSYTEAGSGDIVVTEYGVSSDPDLADPASAREILRVSPLEPFHHGGQLAFGPDGYLYVGIGDGIFSIGYLHATPPNAQDLASLGGKLLRLDVDAEAPYAIPDDNPFVGVDEARGEIYAYGFRNPWKFSFDRETGELYAVDVGNDRWEEIDLVIKGGNYGWPAKEGAECFVFYDTYTPVDPDCEGSDAYLEPLHVYAHLAQDESGGNAVVGGYVYRGERSPAWQGHYFFADFVSGRIWSLQRSGDGVTVIEHLDLDAPVSSFAEGENGELYVLTMDGNLYSLVLD